MAQLPPTLKLLLEDVPSSNRSWMQRIVQPINSFISSVIDALNGNLDFGTNIRAVVKTVTFTNSTSELPIKFSNTLGKRPFGVFVGQALDISDSPIAITNAVSAVDWELNQKGEIQINAFSGLTTGQRYQINLLVI